MHNWVAGEEVTATKLNDLNPTADARISKAEHNILELYLENYFAGKNTPFQGLMFDGFSDTAKSLSESGSMLSAAAGQPNVNMLTNGDRDAFSIGDLVHIYDSVHQEIKSVINKITGSNTAFSESDLNSFGFTQSSPNATFADGGVVSGKRRVNISFNPNSLWENASFSKTFNVVNGTTYTISFNKNLVSGTPTNAWWISTSVIVDGVTKTTVGGDINGTITVTAVASGSTMTVQIRFFTQLNAPTSNFVVDMDTFAATNPVPQLVMDSNLANSYGSGYVKTVSATIDTGGKQLAFPAGVGDGKRVIYQMLPATFSQIMASVKLWIARKITVALNPNGSVAAGATTIAQQGTTGSFATGDTIDIYTADKTVRERKTLSNVVESGGGSVVIDQVTTDLSSIITRTISHTVNVHNDRVLVVAVNCYSSNNGGGLIPTGITYNGVAMTLQVSGNNGNGRNGLSFWKLLNPATGANNLVVTYATAPSASSSSSRVTIIGFYNARDTTAGQNFGFVVNAWTKSINSETNAISIDLCGNDLGNPSQGAGGGQTVQGSDNYRGWCSTIASTGVTTNMGGSNGGYEGNYMGISVLPTLPLLTLTFSPGVIRGAGFSTSDFFERVDVLPKISVGASGNALSYVDLTYVKSLDLLVDGLTFTEDEYNYTPGTPDRKIGVRVDVTRSNTGFAPNAKRLGVSLNT